MSLQYCANLVHEEDLHRFKSAMATSLALRRVLLPIYALNVEIIRAPHASSEPLIAEMRLQWWYDVLEEMKAGQSRPHPVIDTVKEVITPSGIDAMLAALDARRSDIAGYEFEGGQAMMAYVEATTFGPIWAAYAALKGRDEYLLNIRSMAQLIGLARFYKVAPDMVRAFAPPADRMMKEWRAQVGLLHQKGPERAALIESAGTVPLLKHMQKDGPLPVPDFALRVAAARAKLAFGISLDLF